MAGYLTTHVLDTHLGRPAAGLALSLYRIEGGGRELLHAARTNADGRTDAPVLPEGAFRTGIYELVFDAGAYLDAQGAPGGEPRFLGQIPIRFGMSDEVHYHVPLLLSAHGYSTYRGS